MDGTGIYQLSGRGVKSVNDYDMEAANLDAAKQQKQLRAMQILTGQNALDQQQQQVARTGALRQLAGTWGSDTTDDQRIGSLKNAGFFDEADKLEKGLLDRKKTEAEAKFKMSEADKNRLGLFTTKLEQNHKMWESVTNPAEAHALVDATFADPEMAAVARAQGQTPEMAHQSIPDGSDPKAFQDFLLNRSKGMDALIKFIRPDANTVSNNQTSTANNAATNARVAAEGAANRAQQERQHAATRTDAAQAVTYQTDPDTGQTVALPSRLAPGAPVEARGVTIGGVPLKGASKQKEIPATVNQKIIESTQSISNIDNAIKAVEENPGAFGLVNAIPGVERMRQGDTKGVDARAQVANIGSLKLHDRSGAAVSASEFPRLAPFIPSASDSAEAVKTKLKKMKEIAESELGLFADSYGPDQGYKASPLLKKKQPAAATNIDDLLNKYK